MEEIWRLFAEENRPQTKAEMDTNTEEAEPEQTAHMQDAESRRTADAEAAIGMQGQV